MVAVIDTEVCRRWLGQYEGEYASCKKGMTGREFDYHSESVGPDVKQK